MSLKRYNGSSFIDVNNVRRYNGSSWTDCGSMKKYDGSWKDVWPDEEVIIGPGHYDTSNFDNLRLYMNNSGAYYYHYKQLNSDSRGIYIENTTNISSGIMAYSHGIWAPKNPVNISKYNKLIFEYIFTSVDGKWYNHRFRGVNIMVFTEYPDNGDHKNCPKDKRYNIRNNPPVDDDYTQRYYIAPTYHSHYFRDTYRDSSGNIQTRDEEINIFCSETESIDYYKTITCLNDKPIKFEIPLTKIKQSGFTNVYICIETTDGDGAPKRLYLTKFAYAR